MGMVAWLFPSSNLIDLARGNIVVLGKGDVKESLIVAQVEVSLGGKEKLLLTKRAQKENSSQTSIKTHFAAIVQHKNLAVFEWGHCAGVHVQVGI